MKCGSNFKKHQALLEKRAANCQHYSLLASITNFITLIFQCNHAVFSLIVSKHLVFGVAEQLLLVLHKAHGGDRSVVAAEHTHRFRGHVRIPQQDLMIESRCGYNKNSVSHERIYYVDSP